MPQKVFMVPAIQQSQPIEPQAPARPPEEVGYIKRVAMAIADFVVWIFRKICCCCSREEIPIAPIVPIVSPPPVSPDVKLRDRSKEMPSKEELFQLFNNRFNDLERKGVYEALGVAPQWSRFWRSPTVEEIKAHKIKDGEEKVKGNPELILPLIIQKIERGLPA